MENMTLIAGGEFVIIVILVYLIVFRKIGRPLSEAEAQEKIARQKQKELARHEEQRQQAVIIQRRQNEVRAQDALIRKLKTPVRHINAHTRKYVHTVCVSDADGQIHNFSAHEDDTKEGFAPVFTSLFNSAVPGRYQQVDTGTILIPGKAERVTA